MKNPWSILLVAWIIFLVIDGVMVYQGMQVSARSVFISDFFIVLLLLYLFCKERKE